MIFDIAGVDVLAVVLDVLEEGRLISVVLFFL
jgi:hypothetical protein